MPSEPRSVSSASLVLETLRGQGSALGSLNERTVGAMMGIAANNVRLLRANVPPRFRGDVVHFTATRGRRPGGPGAAGLWQPFVTGRIEDHAVDCGHGQMTQAGPAAVIGGVIAGKLARWSDRPRARGLG